MNNRPYHRRTAIAFILMGFAMAVSVAIILPNSPGTWFSAAAVTVPWWVAAGIKFLMARENTPVEVLHMVRLPPPSDVGT